MRVILSVIWGGDLEVTFDWAEPQYLFIDLLLPKHRGEVLGKDQSPFPKLHHIYNEDKVPPQIAEVERKDGWFVSYDCSRTIEGEYRVKFPTYSVQALMSLEPLKVTIKGEHGVTVFKLPPPPGVQVDPDTHTIQVRSSS